MYRPYMYLKINVIHTDVLKFIGQIFSINSVIFDCIHNFIFTIKLCFKKSVFILIYNYIFSLYAIL